MVQDGTAAIAGEASSQDDTQQEPVDDRHCEEA